MENNLSLHIRTFNDKIKVMNQSGKQNLTLSSQEARSLHADIMDLLTLCANLSKQVNSNQNQATNINMDGGSW